MHHIAGEQCRWTGGKIWGKTHKWTESWITRKWGKSFFGTKTTGLNIRYARDMPSISIQYRPNYFNYSSLVAKLPLKHFRLITNGSGHTEICIQLYYIKSLYKGTVQPGYGHLLSNSKLIWLSSIEHKRSLNLNIEPEQLGLCSYSYNKKQMGRDGVVEPHKQTITP